MPAFDVFSLVANLLLSIYPDLAVWGILSLVVLLVMCWITRQPGSITVQLLMTYSFMMVSVSFASQVFDFIKAGLFALTGLLLVVAFLRHMRR